MFNISFNKFPILLISNYRTGCTEFGFRMSRKLNCKWYTEPIRKEKMKNDFITHIESGKKDFVIKFMIDQFDDLPQYRDLLNEDNTKIRFLRRNEIDQITSYYISRITDKWGQRTKSVEEYAVPRDEELALQCMRIICENNRNLINSNIDFDHTLYYEDFSYDGIGLQFKTQQPINIKSIQKMITTMYKEAGYGS